MSDVHAHAQGVALELLSAEYAFYHAASRMPASGYFDGLPFNVMADAIRIDGQPLEALYPYQPTIHPHAPLRTPPAMDPKSIYMRPAKRGIDKSLPFVKELLGGKPVVLMLEVTMRMMMVSGPVYLVEQDSTLKKLGLHAVTAVGVGVDANQNQCIRVRNSWGAGWADAGHAWIHADFIKANLESFAVFQ